MTSYPVESRVIRGGAMTAAPVDTRAGYHTYTSARVICRVTVTSVTAAARVGLTLSELHDIVVGWMFGSVGCHSTITGAELSFELDYTI